MKFLKVNMTHFRRMGQNVEVPLDLPGLTLISGENCDAEHASSNGASKSSVLYAICYALYGKCPDGQAADDVVHVEAGSGCRVVLTLEDDNGSIVEVTRTRKEKDKVKPNDLFLTLDGVDISGSTNELTQEKILQVVGMEMDVFTALMPGLGADVSSMSDAEIKSLFERIMRTEELAVAHGMAKDELKETQRQLDSIMAEAGSMRAALVSSKIRLQTYVANRDSFETQKDLEINKLKKELKEAKTEAKAAVAAYNQAKDNPVYAPTATDLADLEEALAEARKKSSSLRKEAEKLTTPYIKRKAELEAEINATTAQVTKFSALNKCPTCMGVVSSDHKHAILGDWTRTAAEAKRALYGLTTEYDTKFALLVPQMQEAELAEEKTGEALSKAKAANASSSQLVSAYTREVALLKKEAEKVLSSAKKLAGQIDARSKETNAFEGLVTQEERVISTLEGDIQELEATVRTRQAHLECVKFWVEGFSPSGIRSYMMEHIIPYLNDRAKYYCDAISGDDLSVVFHTKTVQKSGKVVEKFHIEVSLAHGSPSIKGASKGERARANLVIALTLGDLAALRASKKLQFMCIDEILDSIDSAGDDAIVELLQSLEKKLGTVYVITHKSSFKDKFDKEIIIQKKDGYSSLKGVFER